MQYFAALTQGKKRVEAARVYLNDIPEAGGRAMPALALKPASKDNVWTPVGTEMLYAFVDESSGFVLTDKSGHILAIVDNDGLSKTVIQGVTPPQKEALIKSFQADNIPEYKGMVTLPV
ncbi:hypothetical protein CENSYa_0235 [Cenarchaeum symbiosum A]|uniref:Uncharacterized protein n=1 Tax=Cenarchaeum symbiosum (strain A) TaxID=414004 RepID=A0RU60_CENSY|nr:hypothetical protein CENSYa_0235 [Cenarchaeum symbiosum A]